MRRLLSPTLPVVLLNFAFQFATPATADGADYLTYTEFIEAVENGEVMKVQLNQFSKISGTYRSKEGNKQFECFGDTGSGNDLLLNRLLAQHGVATSINSEETPFPLMESIFLPIMFFVVPITTLVLVFRIHWKLKRLCEPSQPTSLDSEFSKF
jgi:ATP-dependent Zn protease